MKKTVLFFATLLFLCLFSCQSNFDKQAIEASIEEQYAAYPKMHLQDFYKNFFQDRFGPGHLISDREAALAAIKAELAQADTIGCRTTELCGWRHNYVRVSLSVVRDSLISAVQLTDALMASAKPVSDEDIRQWKKEWALILSIIEQKHPDLPDFDREKQSIQQALASGQYVFHHSDAFNKAYHPHYRLISMEQYKNFGISQKQK
jgi:hypothetical protein